MPTSSLTLRHGVLDNHRHRTVFQVLDDARLSHFHIRCALIAGAGFASSSYALFGMKMIKYAIAHIYFRGTLPDAVRQLFMLCTLLGTAAGAILWGLAGDAHGRRTAYVASLSVFVGGCLLCATSFGTTSTAVVGSLAAFRALAGVGIGGDYPLTAVFQAEYANTAHRGKLLAIVSAHQTIGIIISSCVAMALAGIWEIATLSVDLYWRTMIATASISSILIFVVRNGIPESPRFTMFVERNEARASDDVAHLIQFPVRRNMDGHPEEWAWASIAAGFWRPLVGCSLTWMLLDMVYYALNFYQIELYKMSGAYDKDTMSIYGDLRYQAWIQLQAALAGLAPGVLLSILLIDRIGRRPLQILGFLGLSATMIALAAIPYHSNASFVVLYTLALFFCNLGPNVTTYVLPAEVFPTRTRCTLYGVAAAVGKLGAVAGLEVVYRLSQNGLSRNMFWFMALAALLGAIATPMVPETIHQTLEYISKDVVDLPEATAPTAFLRTMASVPFQGDTATALDLFRISTVQSRPGTHVQAAASVYPTLPVFGSNMPIQFFDSPFSPEIRRSEEVPPNEED